MRVLILSGALILAGCSARPDTEQADYGAAATQCIINEARAVASANTDLETAAYAVIARCSSELTAERRVLPNRFPGYRDYMEPRLRELDALRRDQARQAVATFRTRN